MPERTELEPLPYNTIPQAICAAAAKYGEKPAIIDGARRVSYAELGVQAAGGCIVPLNTRFKGGEAGYILGRSRARFLVVTEKFLGESFRDKLAGQDLPALERIVALPSVS